MLLRGQHHLLRRPLASSLHSDVNHPLHEVKESGKVLLKKPPVLTGPNVYVSRKEYSEYVKPLSQYYWNIRYFTRDFYLKDGELCSTTFNSPYLKRDMHFHGAENTKRFMDKLNRISKAAKHEPFLTIRKPEYGAHDAYRITVLLSTPQCHDVPSLLHEGKTRIGPGISVYDARFATVAEKAFSRFLWAKRGFESQQIQPTLPVNVAKIKKKQKIEDLELVTKESRRHTFMPTPSLNSTIPQSVPEVPPSVSDQLCTDSDFEEVIVPLFSRGWFVVYNNVADNVNGKVALQKQPVLSGFFKFTSFDAAIRFSQDVLEVANAEQIAVSLWLDARTVTVQGVSEVNGSDLMKRDARFAVLVERLFVEKYSRHARQSQVQSMRFLSQPNTVEELNMHPAKRSHRTYMWEKWHKILKRKRKDVTTSHVVVE